MLACVMTVACSGSSEIIAGPTEETGPSLADAQIAIVSGNDQVGDVGEPLAGPLVVQVVDASGEPFVGVAVEWTFIQGAGQAGQGQPAELVTVATDGSGRASVIWQLGTTAGVQQAEAAIPAPSPAAGAQQAPGNGNGKKIGLTARARPGPAQTLTVTPGSITLPEGSSAQLEGSASDRYGNQIESADITWASSDESVAQTTESGMVYAVAEGETSVTASYNNTEATATVTVSSTTTNQAPSASIDSPAQDVTIDLGDAVSFTGSASDPDGSVATHRWTFGDGNTASVEDPGAYTYAAAGTYTASYRVWDDQGVRSAVVSRTVTVLSASNQAPTATITSPSQNVTVTLGEPVNFQGSGSDPDGTVVSHRWTFGDGNTASVEDPGDYLYSSAGIYSVTYRVTDDQQAQSTVASRTVTVQDGSPPPPPPNGPDFVSNFEGSDWRDNGKWQAVGGMNHDSYLRTFTSSLDPDVPGGRGLRTIGTDNDDFWNVIRPTSTSQPRTPAVGESITWRFYYKLISGDGDGDYHPIDWGTNLLNSSPNFAVFKFVWFNGAWQPQIHIQGAPRPWYATEQSMLSPNVWYRFEVSWNRTGSSSWTVSYRIYGPSGALLVDGGDMFGNFGSEPGNPLSNATFNNSAVDRSAMLEIGSPGVGGLSGSPHEAERYAAIAAFVGGPVVNVPFDPARGW